ncbi:hypothetical protein Tco_0627212 [Tanacetum coccineum]|uniref:Uncharacterized protein n=1 Tax=Tanacetum coccineum TaxID=301880 RepID=A0ABQ4WLS3_9ASTR
MEPKDTLSSCSDLEEKEIQQLQMQAKLLKENSMNKFNAFKTTTQNLKRQTFTTCPLFQQAFAHLFSKYVRTFKFELSQNMQNLERQLNKETLHEKDSKSDLSLIKVHFDKFIHSKVLKPSNYNLYDQEVRNNFKVYTKMEAETFKEAIIQDMDSIEQCIIQECKVQEVKASNASSGDKDSSGIVSDKGNNQNLENQSNTSGDESSRPSYDKYPMVEVPYTAEYNVFAIETQHFEQPKNINDTYVMEKDDINVIPDLSNMCDNDNQVDQNAEACDDERVAFANLIVNLKLDIDENKKIQKQLKKAKTSLTQELKECKSTLEETNRTLGECNSTRDSCLIALQNKQTELEKYKDFNDRTTDYDKLEPYKISVVKKEHDDLVKQSLLTKSRYEGLVKEKNQVIKDLKLKEENDIDKLITMEKQLKFLNEIIPYDTSDLANRFAPNREETLTLEQESRLKLNKD